jgi:hypothetical protein
MEKLGKKINALFWALACFAVFSYTWRSWQEFVVAVLTVVLLATAANLMIFRNSFRKGMEITILLLPIFWLGSGSFLISLIGWTTVQTLIILFWTVGFFLIELWLDEMSLQLFEGAYFISATGIFLGVWAADFYFSPGWWMIMALVFLFSFLLFALGFRAVPVSQSEKLLYALILALVMTEVSWTMLYWPLHFYPLTVAFVGVFYLTWMFTRLSLSRVLTIKKIIFHLVLFGIMELLALATAAWLPVS